ncbi:MAG: poly-gamma-glutamate system protein [Candidatus Saccharicenans sp.]|jgi:poly-gamma-glutamate system protein|nr:poly-gamma-glutamate system protein [Candidatus Saccharicenans sp.]MDH7574540.1 poly-gamma-glutamate system protein [Candidatus Saccharicenans sp.]
MGNDKKFITLVGLAVLSLVFLGLYLSLGQDINRCSGPDPDGIEASRLMSEAEKIIFNCRKSRGIQPENNEFDPNQTGLVGLENSPLTTTLGNLQAKRTATNPELAALLVHLLRKAGVRQGEVVSLGASASFPSLIVASYCAARALDLELLAIVSVGASQWGANHPEFSWLDMEDCLRQHGFTRHRLLAVAWGGEDDSGKEYPEEVRKRLLAVAQRLGLQFLPTGSLEDRVRQHLDLFLAAAGERKIKAFINIGGSSVNLGADSSVLELKPGLTRVGKIPPASRRGLIQEMARRGIPVIHLLNIRKLAEIYGLPWDPKPLPAPGGLVFPPERRPDKTMAWLIFGGYLLSCVLWLMAAGIIRKKAFRPAPGQDS